MQDWRLNAVEIRTTKVMIIVICRVFPYRIPNSSVHRSLHRCEIILIACKLLLFFIIQSVKAKVLQFTAATRCRESVIYRRLCWNFSPLCGDIRRRSINRQTTFIELFAIAQHVFRHLSKVNVEVATILCRVASPVTVNKWVHKPELNIFNISRFEIVSVQLSHHTAPMLLWVKQFSCWRKIGVKIIWTALVGVISHVQNRQCRRCSAIRTLVASRIKLTYIHISHVRIT